MKLHRCPECQTEALVTPEQKGAIHIDCPVCLSGSVFRDARGGYECRSGKGACDTGSPASVRGRPGCGQRFLIHGDSPDGYGGPGGPLRWWERPLTGWGALGILTVLGLSVLLARDFFPAIVLALFFWRYWYDEHHRGTPPRRRG